jgi:hypothetical protein
MAKADEQNTSPCYYSEEARAELRKHIEQVLARRQTCLKIDEWNQLWNILEATARTYFSSVKSSSISSSVSDTRKGLDKCLAQIDDLLRELKKPALLNWNFISDSNDPFCRILKTEPLRDVADTLTAVRKRIVAETKELQEFGAGQTLRAYNAYDCVREFKGRVFEIGHEAFGRKVGGERGPLITFVYQALLPVLKDATPDFDAFRKFARERKKDWLGEEDRDPDLSQRSSMEDRRPI